MAGKLKSLVISFFVGLIILFQGWRFYERRKDSAYQQNLLEQVKMLSKQKIVNLDIIPGTMKNQETPKQILTLDEIQAVQELLKTADIGRIGGHNFRVYECVLTFELEENVTTSFWGIVYGRYEWNKDDAFLLGYEQSGSFNSFYSQLRVIRVKNLGKWLVESGPKKQAHN